VNDGCINCRLPDQIQSNIDEVIATTLKQQKSPFQVIAVKDSENRTSFWGVIDLKTTPEEDVYLEATRRYCAAVHSIGLGNIQFFGMIDISQVITRSGY
jgi:hypothetical protein